MHHAANSSVNAIYAASTPIIEILGVGGNRWKRNVQRGGRIGPWLQANYRIIDEAAWNDKRACLYLVRGNDSVVRYVGISRNGVRHRWRTSPAFDAETMVKLPQPQLFHSQCFKHIEIECVNQPGRTFEVRSICGQELINVIKGIGAPLSGFLALGNDHEGLVASVERWICNNSSDKLVTWNVAMTNK